MQSRPRTVSSIFSNLERVLVDLAPRSAQILLGVRWSFGLPRELPEFLVEYSFPLSPIPFVELLRIRSGLQITIHHDDQAQTLDDYLATGRPAIVAVDSFYLPYRPAYGRVHSSRTIIVRAGSRSGEVHVTDGWTPCYEGSLPWIDLERARYSSVPREQKLEPIFSGWAIDGEWFSVEVVSTPIVDVNAWVITILKALHEEATCPVADDHGEYGIAAMRELCRQLEAVFIGSSGEKESFASYRTISLLLRAELSARIYLCAFLRTAATWLGNTHLYDEVGVYYSNLRYMEAARDVLTKSLIHFRPEYGDYILTCLARAIESEGRLATTVLATAFTSNLEQEVPCLKS